LDYGLWYFIGNFKIKKLKIIFQRVPKMLFETMIGEIMRKEIINAGSDIIYFFTAIASVGILIRTMSPYIFFLSLRSFSLISWLVDGILMIEFHTN
jgi:hypothetical protein